MASGPPGAPGVTSAATDPAVTLAIALLNHADEIVRFLAACSVGVDVPADVQADARELLEAITEGGRA
jgi:hypothetical protein